MEIGYLRNIPEDDRSVRATTAIVLIRRTWQTDEGSFGRDNGRSSYNSPATAVSATATRSVLESA